MAYRYANLSLKLSAVKKKNQLKAQKYADTRQNAAIDGQYNDVQDRIADEDIAVPKPWTLNPSVVVRIHLPQLFPALHFHHDTRPFSSISDLRFDRA